MRERSDDKINRGKIKMGNLKEHNIPVFEKLENILLNKRKAIIITGTGTGKSYLSLEFIERYNLRALVVIPYNTLKSQWEKLNRNKIDTCTYIYFSRHVDDILESNYDIVIFDEAQHCGAKTWQSPIERFMHETDKYVLGLSADAKRYSDAGKDMAAYLWGENIVYGYDVGEAIDKGILPSITYISALYDTSGFDDVISNNSVSKILLGKLNTYLKNLESVETILKKNMPEPRKTVVFVDTVERLDIFVDIIQNAYPNTPIYTIHSKQPSSINNGQLEAFENSESAFIFSINMLNEGLHAKGADTCIMFRLTGSPTIYFQQIGRSLSSGGRESIIFDFVSNRYHLKVNNIPDIRRCKLFSNSKVEYKVSEQIIIKDYTEALCDILDEIRASLDETWKDEEIAILKEYYPTEGVRVSRRLPGRTKHACGIKANSLGIRYVRQKFWNTDMVDFLTENYSTLGPTKIASILSISVSETKKKARELGITNSSRGREWTQELKNELLAKYKQYGKECFTMMDGFSKDAVRKQLTKMGVEYSNKLWTKEQIDILIQNADKSFHELEQLTGRSVLSVKKKFYELGLRKEK